MRVNAPWWETTMFLWFKHPVEWWLSVLELTHPEGRQLGFLRSTHPVEWWRSVLEFSYPEGRRLHFSFMVYAPGKETINFFFEFTHPEGRRLAFKIKAPGRETIISFSGIQFLISPGMISTLIFHRHSLSLHHIHTTKLGHLYLITFYFERVKMQAIYALEYKIIK
jgi:hypothetical protein